MLCKDNDNKISNICQVPDSTNPAVNAVLLTNEKFTWKDKKERTRLLAKLFRSDGNISYSRRASSCGSFLEFNFLEADDDGSNLRKAIINGKKQLSGANFCQLRTCPLCNARRSAKLAVMLTNCIDKINENHVGLRYLFLTLALKNCSADDLPDTITHLLKSFDRLMKRRNVKRAIKGFFRTMEITFNELQDSYHPHLHVLLVVEDDYFKRSNNLYITQDAWVKMWSECLKVDYLATANIKRADKSKKAIAEVSKYAVKDTDYLKLAERDKDKAVEVVRTFTHALYRRRLIQAGGLFKQYWNTDAEDDLLHITEDGEKHSEWYGSYNYSYQVLRDYYLVSAYKKSKDEDGNVRHEDSIYFDYDDD